MKKRSPKRTKKVKTPALLNAAQTQREYPETFERPSAQLLAQIKPDDDVKVAIGEDRDFLKRQGFKPGEGPGGERFWVKVTSRKGDVLVGRIDNQLVCTDKLRLNDLITFHVDNIYDVGT